jgi:hypothetical protein
LASPSTERSLSRVEDVSIIPASTAPRRNGRKRGSRISVAERFGDVLEASARAVDVQAARPLLPEAVVLVAHLGRDREPAGDGQAEAGHLREPRPLAAEQVFLIAAAFGLTGAEEVNALGRHS